MGVTHATVAVGTDSGSGEIHKAEWNATHSGTNDHGHTATGDGGVLPSVISPSQLVATANNWAPTGVGTATVIRVSTDSIVHYISGITTGSSGRELTLVNVGSQPIILPHNDTGSTAANRFTTPGNVNQLLLPDTVARLVYDSTDTRWRVFIDAPMNVSGRFSLSGEISPSQLTGNTDNWGPTGIDSAVVLFASTDASRNLTGLTGGLANGSQARVLILTNTGSFDLVLKHDTTSTSFNRFYCPGSADYTVTANSSVWLRYDLNVLRWRVIR